jgi:EAL domain-containing protein (putative c-di-GMP-specific phosphodiesterase class I)
MIELTRVLGFAFANADLLLEIDADAAIHFAAGATLGLGYKSANDLVGEPAGTLFKFSDAYRLATIAKAIGPGGRIGPLRLTLASGAPVNVSLCYLAVNPGRISCTLSQLGSQGMVNWGGEDPRTGLSERNAFIAAAKTAIDGGHVLTLVELPKLPAICANLSAPDAQKLLKALGDAIKSIGARAAGRVSETAFGVVGDSVEVPQALVDSIEKVASANGVADLVSHKIMMPLEQGDLTPEQSLIALRRVIQRFVEGKLSTDETPTLRGAFDGVVDDALDEAASNRSGVQLAFRPVVELKSGKTCRYAVIPQWPQTAPSGSGIAGETGIADTTDMEILGKTLRVIESDRSAKFRLCVTLSGSVISSPALTALLNGMLEHKKDFAGRLAVAVAATDADNSAATLTAIQHIRRLGYRVGLGNFGGSSASLQQITAVEPDFVNFHPSFLEKLRNAKGDDTLVRSLVSQCEKLGIETCAEGTDDHEAYTRAKEIRFRSGMGAYFGAPMQSITTGAAA